LPSLEKTWSNDGASKKLTSLPLESLTLMFSDDTWVTVPVYVSARAADVTDTSAVDAKASAAARGRLNAWRFSKPGTHRVRAQPLPLVAAEASRFRARAGARRSVANYGEQLAIVEREGSLRCFNFIA